ncbi:MAG: hypothetical protein IJ743_04360 [Bacilli bacterium]|nr:hypothetical protein [Bacilli bacterium]
MRESIGGTWLFQIVIVFILLFTGFMCLSINRSKAFNVKNFILETIQSNNGDLNASMPDIVEYMKSNAYRTSGVKSGDIKPPDNCKGKTIANDYGKYKCYNREGKEDNKNSPVFCVAKLYVDNKNGCLDNKYTELPNMFYYRIVVFYQLDLPFFHDVFNFKITGDTKTFAVS